MGLLKSLLGKTDDPFKTGREPALRPTNRDPLDAQVIPLMLLTSLDYDHSKGHEHHTALMVYTYFIEERLEDAGVPLNRYSWETMERFGGTYPFAPQFLTDLHDGFGDQKSKPPLASQDAFTYDGSPRRYYTVTGYTDLYISKYFEYSTVNPDDVEPHVAAFVDSLPGPVSNNLDDLHDRLVEHDAATYF